MRYRDDQISGVLETFIYLELIRRGYSVYIGKVGSKEIDFVAKKNSENVYIQVAYKLSSEDTIEREFSPLKSIKDNYPKYVVTMEDVWQNSFDGIIIAYMRTGGASNASLRNRLLLNRETVRACQENGLETNLLKISMKYPIKLLEYLSPLFRKH
jgi:hypothetical protein